MTGILERLRALTQGPPCACCGRPSVFRMTVSDRVGYGSVCSEHWACAEHAVRLYDELVGRGSIVEERKWFD